MLNKLCIAVILTYVDNLYTFDYHDENMCRQQINLNGCDEYFLQYI